MTIKNENIFKLLFILRKTLPKQQLFYCLFILFKFISPYLLTHNLKGLDNTSFIFTLGFGRLTLIKENSNSYKNSNYGVISLIIFILIVFMVAFTLLIAYLYSYIKSNDDNKVIKSLPSNSYFLNLPFKRIMKCLFYIHFLIIFLSQHIVEYAFIGIFAKIAIYIDKKINEDHKDQLLYFDRIQSIGLTIIVVLNSLTIIILFIMTYFFFLMASSKTICIRNGNRTMVSNSALVLFVLLFQFQGVYSVLYFYVEEFKYQLRLGYCITIIVLLGIYLIFSIQHYYYTFNASILFLDFMSLVCFISGIFEVIMYFTVSSPIPLNISILMKGLEFTYAFYIVMLIHRRIYNKAIDTISNKLFDDSYNDNANLNYIIVLCTLLSQYLEGKDIWNTLYQSVYYHSYRCNNEHCFCKSLIKKLINRFDKNEKIEIIRIFTLIAEREIVQTIKRKTSDEELFFLLHVDFIHTIQNKLYLTLYLCQYYLIKKSIRLKFHDSYAIYEIYQITLKDMKERKRNNQKGLFNNIALTKQIKNIKENKFNLKKKKLIQNLAILEHIRKNIMKCCIDYQKIMQIRQLMKTNKKNKLSCQTTINQISQLKESNKKLHAILAHYLSQKIIFPGVECYLLHCYFNLVIGRLPLLEYRQKIKKMKSFTEIYINDNTHPYPIMILSLTIDNSLIIKYATLSFIEQLGYTHKEIIGSDLHKTILLSQFSNNHFAQMKLFLLNAPRIMDKETFAFTKNGNATRVNISARPIPTKENLSLIVKFKPITIIDSTEKTYYVITDQYLNIIRTCSAFENRFKINTTILNESNTTLAQFFGVNYESQLAEYSKEHHHHQKKKWLDSFKSFNSILTTVKEEDRLLYYTDHYLHPPKRKTIKKEITLKRFLKSIEALKKCILQCGIDKDWIKNIEELYNEISFMRNDLNEVIFTLTMQLKNLGLDYCILTIHEENVNKTIMIQETNTHRYSGNILKLNQLPGFSSNRQGKSPVSLFRNFDKKLNASSIIYDDKSVNDSHFQLINSINNQHSSVQNERHSSIFVTNKPKTQIENEDLNVPKYVFTLKILKIANWLLWISLILLDFIYLIKSSNAYQQIETYFSISISSYVLSSDIYFNAITCFKSCLVINGLSNESYAFVQMNAKKRVASLILNFYQFTHYINNLNYTSDIAAVYDLLTSYDTYEYMNLNGLISKENTTFIEEIYNMYFSVSNFDPNTQSKCRLKEIFYNDNYLSFTSESNVTTSFEERSLFHMFNNIITIFNLKLFQINKIINKIITDFSDSNTEFVTIWILMIWAIGLVFYHSIIASLILMKKIMRNNMKILFQNIPGEEVFMRNLLKYIELLNNLCFREFDQYENAENRTDNTSLISKPMKKKKNNDFNDNIKDKQKQSYRRHNIQKKEISQIEVKQAAMNSNNEDHVNKRLNKFMILPILIVGIILSLSGIISYILLQVIVIVFTVELKNITNAQNYLSSNFLIRIPKLAELIFYSMRSVLANNQYHFTVNFNDYSYSIISNHYNVTIDIESNSYFKSLGESHFAFIYYQHLLTTQNIQRLQIDEKKDKILPLTIEFESQINQDDYFCIIPPLTYVTYMYPVPTLTERFKRMNVYSTECRSVYHGINLSGFQSTVDLLFQQFINLYIDYFKQDEDKRIIEHFLGSIEYSAFEDDIQLSFRVLSNTQKFLIEDDIKASMIQGGMTDIVFTLISISINTSFGLVTILVFVSIIEKYNATLNEFIIFLVNSIRCNSDNNDNSYNNDIDITNILFND